MADKNHVTKTARQTVRVCGYRLDGAGGVVSKTFDLPAGKPSLPKGWQDTPAKLKKSARPKDAIEPR